MYPTAHNLLTVHWTTLGATNETAQFGLRFDGPGPVSQAMVDEAAPAVQTWWASATGGVQASYILGFLRLARIGTNGEYVPSTQSWDHVYAPAVAGGATAAASFPLQTALCYTLRTGLTHGLAHSGRVYAPAHNSALDGGWQWTSANITSSVNTFSAMLSALDGSSLGQLSIFSFGNTDFPNGAVNPVTQVTADRKPDTQRRRARQLASAYVTPGNVS